MTTSSLFVVTLLWLQVKHFVADYALQPKWMISGKGDLGRPGGYIHAGFHAVASLPILWFSFRDATWVSVVAIGEFLVHFSIDHLKALHARRHPLSTNSRFFTAPTNWRIT